MLKKRLYLRRFLTDFVNIFVTKALETFCELFFKFLDGCFQIFYYESAFCERDENHKFDNFKTIPC